MHVVVVGGGFGGVKAALELSKRQIGKVTLISAEPYFLHHATLYATATGKNMAESVIPLRVIFAHHPNVEIIEDFITSIDAHRKLISSKKRDYHYDKLILALGSVSSDLGIPGIKRHAYGIKSLDDVKEFQDHIHDEIVSKKLDKEYFVIGAGQTGVELAAALTIYLRSLRDMYRLPANTGKVSLIEASSTILPNLSRSARQKVHNELVKQGVSVRTNRKVNALHEDTITIEGVSYPTTTAIWTSGVANNPFYKEHDDVFSLSKNGHVHVNEYLEALDHVYVIGDNNTLKHSHMALPAMQQAKHVAKNIARLATRRPQLPYHSKSVPIGIPVGDTWAYVEWAGMYVDGRLGAFIRRRMELHGYKQLVPAKIAIPLWRAHDLHHVDDDF